MVVHPAIGNQSGTLVNALMHHIQSLSDLGGMIRPGIVHRLDKQTSGVMVVAKNNQTHERLSQMFAKHQVKKTYLALVYGVIEEDQAMINAPIGRHQNDRQKMDVTAKNSKQAITRFKVLERFANATLVSVEIDTGRTHQIRVHFKYINHPVINDPKYGRLKEKVTDYGQYLHSYHLEFVHPTTGKQMSFESPIPQAFNDKIKELRNVV
jgi:23S rRNA pseudouridine1911/1915/1917 synthase